MDTLKFELKATNDSGPGTFEGIMSAPVLDRDNEIVDSKAFEPLPDHIPIDIDHGLTVEKTVGSGKPYYDTDGLLKVKGTFASTPLGQQVRTLVKEGHIRNMSVVFHNPVREIDQKDGKQHVRSGELINCTITGIPANTATLVTAKVGARNSSKDQERLQATHDHMVELGAKCEGKHAHGIFVASDSTSPYIYGNTATSMTKFTLLDEIVNAEVVDLTGSTDTEPPADAASAASAGAQVEVARARASLAVARAQLVL